MANLFVKFVRVFYLPALLTTKVKSPKGLGGSDLEHI